MDWSLFSRNLQCHQHLTISWLVPLISCVLTSGNEEHTIWWKRYLMRCKWSVFPVSLREPRFLIFRSLSYHFKWKAPIEISSVHYHFRKSEHSWSMEPTMILLSVVSPNCMFFVCFSMLNVYSAIYLFWVYKKTT
jgi:hypothetical protein